MYMRTAAYLIIALFFFVYALINYYIGLRGWQYLARFIPGLGQATYWLLFGLLALSYVIARLGSGVLPHAARYLLTLAGSYWLAAMFYLLQIIFILDLLRFLNGWLHFVPAGWQENPRFAPAVGVFVLAFTFAVLVYGTWNARHPRLQHYELNIAKQAGGLEELRAVMVSDIHLGEIIHNSRLSKMVETVNSLQPDIILLPGDIIDEDVGPFIQQDMSSTFQKLRSKYGIFAVPGNHEYIGRHIEAAVHNLQQAGITVLRDECVKVADSFYIVGRDEVSRAHFASGSKPKELAEIMEGVDRRLPVILLNHQPRQLDEAAAQGVDLQLSGHTHRGQLFPNGFITRRIYETDWGYLRKGNLQLIVSSGFGTWGPPIRTGNRPEIVEIVIKFSPRR
ncbi:MAG: metallophosphoesterase [Peptococcaceae bacterium]|jgi:predicted MPP superfamily phosphohydrolase|nr:metallophosphoesterase [Peptococcaceae bacterium]MDH7524014.1 metallophosphoesterase [Peptococcaceae bacterium]